MVRIAKELLGKLSGVSDLIDKTIGLYHKSEADKAQIRDWQNKTRDEILYTQGQGLAMQLRQLMPAIRHIRQAEFKVFSQFGEDGIIQYLLNTIPDLPQRFIEFGVESYIESNTRFLLMHNNWEGLIIDGSDDNLNLVRQSDLHWRHTLHALTAFITKENINDLFRSRGFEGPVGLLSVDIDGNDYWVWEAIQVVQPVIVVAEYNSLFGPDRAISVPYQADFQRSKAHFSHLYFGASLPALTHLAQKKGYELVGVNSTGSNAFFVLKSHLNGLPTYSAKEAFSICLCREERDPSGKILFTSYEERKKTIEGLPVINVITGEKEVV
jgi:hypothetical protein